MTRRTTIEIDEDLLRRAQDVLHTTTMRSTIEEALRRSLSAAEDAGARRRAAQHTYFENLAGWTDPEVLASDEMWR